MAGAAAITDSDFASGGGGGGDITAIGGGSCGGGGGDGGGGDGGGGGGGDSGGGGGGGGARIAFALDLVADAAVAAGRFNRALISLIRTKNGSVSLGSNVSEAAASSLTAALKSSDRKEIENTNRRT